MAFWRRCWLEQDAQPPPAAHRELEQERWHSVLVTAKRYGVDSAAGRARAHACVNSFIAN